MMNERERNGLSFVSTAAAAVGNERTEHERRANCRAARRRLVQSATAAAMTAAAASIVSGRGTRRGGVFLVGDPKNIVWANVDAEFGYRRLFYVIVFFTSSKQDKKYIYMALTRNATAKDTLGVGGLIFERIRDFEYLEININEKKTLCTVQLGRDRIRQTDVTSQRKKCFPPIYCPDVKSNIYTVHATHIDVHTRVVV